MKRVSCFVFLLVLAIVATLPVTGQKSDYSGVWKIDKQKSVLPEYLPSLSKISIKIEGDSLFTERVYDGGEGQEYPFNESITLDGKEYRMIIYDMPRKLKANWSEQDGSLIVESTTTFNGQNGAEDFISRETWKIDKANSTLTINFKNTISGGESEGYFFFNRAEQSK